jgi:hypothetical protein
MLTTVMASLAIPVAAANDFSKLSNTSSSFFAVKAVKLASSKEYATATSTGVRVGDGVGDGVGDAVGAGVGLAVGAAVGGAGVVFVSF